MILNSKVQIMLCTYVDCDATRQGMHCIWNVQLHYVLEAEFNNLDLLNAPMWKGRSHNVLSMPC